MAIDYSAIAAAGGIGKGIPRDLAKGWKKAEFKKQMDAAYAVVNQRDGDRSRLTGIELRADHPNPKCRREHNHLEERSTNPARRTDPSNIFLCSTFEHKFITNNSIIIEGTDANEKLIFHWNRRIVPPGKEPFKLLSKRRTGR